MGDGLEQVLNRVIDWVKYEEAKNAALITMNGVGAGVILQWLSSSSVSATLGRCLKGSSVALLNLATGRAFQLLSSAKR